MEKSLITTTEAMVRDVAHERAQLVIAKFRTSIRPIYRSAPKTLLTHVGTCTLLCIEDIKFIVTAAHIVDQHEGYLWIGGKESAIPLEGAFRSTVAPRGERALDKYDFSVSTVSDELDSSLGNASYISSDFISMGRRADHKHSMYTCVGYPNSQNKEVDVGKREMNARLWMHTARGRSNDDKIGGWAKNSEHHLFIEFPKYANRVDGTKKSSTHPRGTSGGPVFYLGDFGDPETYRVGSTFQSRLEGIVIEKPRMGNALVAVKIAAIVQALRNARVLQS
jgi:hypothetical protein